MVHRVDEPSGETDVASKSRERRDVSREPWRLPPLLLSAPFVLVLALVIIGSPSDASITGDAPPSWGDWTIGNSTSVVGETVTVMGDLLVASDLTLENTTLSVVSTSPGDHGIVVSVGGRLQAADTVLRASGTNGFTFVVRGRMDLERVTVSGLHGGIRVETDQAVELHDCLISDFSAFALHLEDANRTVVEDVRVQSSSLYYRISLPGAVSGTERRTVVHAAPRGVVRIDGGRPVIDGLDISVNATADILVNVTKRERVADVELVCDWPVVEVRTRDAITISDVRLRDTILDLTAWFHVDNRVSGGVALCTATQASGVVSVRDHRNLTVEGVSMDRRVHDDPPMKVSYSGYDLDDVQIASADGGNWLVQTILRETYTTRGPHVYRLHIRDIDAGANSVLDHRLEPFYSGTQDLTFRYTVLLENITSRGGQDLVRFLTSPRFGTTKYIEADVRITRSVFEDAGSFVLRVENEVGPSTVKKSNLLTGMYRVDNSSFVGCRLGPVGLVSFPVVFWGGGLSQDVYDTEVSVVDCVFRDNIGRLINAGGAQGLRKDYDSFNLMGCRLVNNTCLFGDELINASLRTNVVIANNTFEDNTVSRGIMLTDCGGVGLQRDLCDFTISDNVFRNNTASGPGSFPRAFIDVWWGGYLVVANNTVERTGSYFLNLTEITFLSRKAVLDLHHNLVHNNSWTVVHFRQTDRNHTLLVAYVRDNVVRDNQGPFVSYLVSSPYLVSRDYDAVIRILDNLVVRNNSTAIQVYGNLTVRGNTFIDCKGWALSIEYLHWHAPIIKDNVLVGCENGMRVWAKPFYPIKVLLWVDNTEIECSGTAFHFIMMEVTIRNSTISQGADLAVMAVTSMVDMYNCQLEAGSAIVNVDGYVRAWHWVEATVTWANASGEPSGNPVPGAKVSFFDKDGNWTATVITDPIGQMERTEVLHWELGRNRPYVVHSPYLVVTSVSSYTSTVRVHVNRSYLGSEALDLLLVDPSVPTLIIQSPMDGDELSARRLEVVGFAEDDVSGLHVVQVAIGDGVYETVYPNETGVFHHLIANVPEGMVVIKARAVDRALNIRVASVVVLIDNTPPALVVTYPTDGLITNELRLTVWGETERGALVRINLWSEVSTDGEFFTVVALMEGRNTLQISASDRVGNTAWENLTVTLDTVRPVIDLARPEDGWVTNRTRIDVVGRIYEPTSMTVTLHRQHTDIIDEPIDVDQEGHFSKEVELEEGENTIVVTAEDLAGNVYTVKVSVFLDLTPPLVQLHTPADGTRTTARRILVQGRVGEDAVEVYLNGRRMLDLPFIDETITLEEGANRIELRARDVFGNEAVRSVTVTLDTTPPELTITDPAKGFLRTNVSHVVLRGWVGPDAVTLTVMGNDVTSTNGAFEYHLVLAHDGVYEVEVLATDALGNVAKEVVTFDRSTAPPALMVVFHPDSAVIRADWATVKLVGNIGVGVTNVTVIIASGGTVTRWVHPVAIGEDNFIIHVELAQGENVITLRVVDHYGNWNSTSPHSVTLRTPDLEEQGIPTTSILLGAVILALVFVLALLLVLTRRRMGGALERT